MASIEIPGVAPEEDCRGCNGWGSFCLDQPGRPIQICKKCNGTGTVLTEFGECMLDFMRKHLPALLAELEDQTGRLSR
jgi:DnaJ-class molecular chaperone